MTSSSVSVVIGTGNALAPAAAAAAAAAVGVAVEKAAAAVVAAVRRATPALSRASSAMAGELGWRVVVTRLQLLAAMTCACLFVVIMTASAS